MQQQQQPRGILSVSTRSQRDELRWWRRHTYIYMYILYKTTTIYVRLLLTFVRAQSCDLVDGFSRCQQRLYCWMLTSTMMLQSWLVMIWKMTATSTKTTNATKAAAAAMIIIVILTNKWQQYHVVIVARTFSGNALQHYICTYMHECMFVCVCVCKRVAWLRYTCQQQ